LEKIIESELAGLKYDTISRKAFLRKSFSLGGIGALLFIVAVPTLVFYGTHLPLPVSIGIFVLAALGLVFEFGVNFRARRSKPICQNCNSPFSKYLNGDRPEDTEYVYVCHKCEAFFKVLYGEKPTNYS
jgi:hypothetical protein